MIYCSGVLNQMADTVVIIDDLRLSDSASVMRQQEQRLDNLIRVTANNVGKETMKYAYEVHGSALFTGEYALKNKSTNNRIILLEFYKEDLDKAKLSMVERDPGNLSVFFYWFIKWSIKHYEKIVSAIKENCDEYIRQRIKEEPYQERLQLHANKLVIAYKIFLDFCKDRNWNIGYQLNDFKRLMENVITAQIESLELEGREREDYVVELYSRCYDEIDSHDICMKDPKKTGWNQKLYYDQERELVYIPNATVEDFLNELKAPVSVHTVMNDFESLGLLNTDNSKQHTRTKKCARKRCYVISFDKWTDYVREVVERENQ